MAPSSSEAVLPRLRTLASFLTPHRRTMLLGLALGLAANAAGLATPMVTKWVLDTLGAGQSMARPIGVLLALVVVGAAITLCQWRLLGTLAEHIVLDARAAIVRRYLRARVGDLQRRPTGELVTRVTSDTHLLREASGSIVGLVNAGIALAGTLVLMGVLDLFLLGCHHRGRTGGRGGDGRADAPDRGGGGRGAGVDGAARRGAGGRAACDPHGQRRAAPRPGWASAWSPTRARPRRTAYGRRG